MKLHDSLSKQLKELSNKEPLKIYLCGPTVYDDVHIGNVAPVIVFDFLIRYLRSQNINYTYVHNITDIDDKIVNKAKELGVDEEEISKKYERRYLEILKQLDVITPNIMPRVSEHIGEIQAVISKLLEKGYAEVLDGDVIFKALEVDQYGELSKQKISELKSYSNFCLGKKMEEGKTGDSPGGKGRPGGHTECFAFIDKYLGGNVHIHGGGIDLKFPHHENENAHCRALYGCCLAQIGVHIGHLTTEKGKISKSDNNKYLMKDLLEHYHANIVRLLFLTNNYSIPSLITDSKLDELNKEWNSFKLAINKAISKVYLVTGSLLEFVEEEPNEEVLNYLSEDLNLPGVLTGLQSIKKQLLTSIKQNQLEEMKRLCQLLKNNLKFLGFSIKDEHTPESLEMLKQGQKCVSNQKGPEADEIRKKLMDLQLWG